MPPENSTSLAAVIDPEPVERTRPHTQAQRHFRKLWEHCRSVRQQNESLQQELDALVDRLAREVHPAEYDMGLAVRSLCHSLLIFSTRKSLTQWQRQELESWIAETIDELEGLGMLDDDLREQLARSNAEALGLDLDANPDRSAREQLDAFVASLHEQAASQRGESGSTDSASGFEEWMAELMGDEPGRKSGDARYGEQLGFAFDDEADEADDDRAGIDTSDRVDDHGRDLDSLFKMLFRRTARALHPDKEPDDAAREGKQALMASLLAARRSADLIAVFELYAEHVDAAFTFDDGVYRQLERVLNRFLESQELRQDEIVNSTPMHRIAHERFHGTSADAIDKRIRQHLALVQERRTQLLGFTRNVRSLNALRPFLEDRYDQGVGDACTRA